MPPKRKGSPCASHHRKKLRMKVLDDNLSAESPTPGHDVPSTFSRNFSVRRLTSGHKGQRRAKTVPFHDGTSSTTVVDEEGANGVDIKSTTCNMDDEHATTPQTTPGKSRKTTAQRKDYSTAVCSSAPFLHIRVLSVHSQKKISIWLAHHDLILDELIRQDGHGVQDSSGFCRMCKASPGLYRCMDCSRGTLLCQTCIVDRHTQLQSPLHQIEVRYTDLSEVTSYLCY